MSVLDPDEDPGGFDPSDYGIAGYLPLGGDFESDYVNTEQWETVSESVLMETDYVVLHDLENDLYFTLGGPFDDYEDLYDAIQEYQEEGS